MKKFLMVLLLAAANVAFAYELENCTACDGGVQTCDFLSGGKKVGTVSVFCAPPAV